MSDIARLELVVVRHGLTAWNRERRYQGQRDIPLLLPEALADMDRLRDALADVAFDAIHCSDLIRCRQTLAHLLEGRGATPRFDARLRELDFGDYEGRTWEALKDDPGYRAWVDSHGRRATPGGESAEDLWARLSAWLEGVLAEARESRHRRVLAVSHGGAIRELRRRLEAVDFWDGVVGQAQGRRFVFVRQGSDWQCSCSSAVPVPASATP
ncbi:histidine phosphatase family protein [Halomonas sp. M4R1S46]|uniref:histidine phosphatase family protein n=1 Tax=Halomonas sp. M4R1S46 TaxID=2982692 RepID=UPI0021E511BE|nr:histidine phosphatase family protein [Halomonas sp. M4R1S46]UYG08740.1 histidine phosphatase family protein [Halomonas sp. M4R1S46]